MKSLRDEICLMAGLNYKADLISSDAKAEDFIRT